MQTRVDGQALDEQFRRADQDDVETVIAFLLAMLQEMAALGGHRVAQGERAVTWLRRRCTTLIHDPDHLFLLAAATEQDAGSIGLVEARLTQPPAVFRAKRVLRIHSLYVLPGYRRRGVGRLLLDGALEWGRACSCVEAELSTLCGNPARRLYESLGFVSAEVEMRRRL